MQTKNLCKLLLLIFADGNLGAIYVLFKIEFLQSDSNNVCIFKVFTNNCK